MKHTRYLLDTNICVFFMKGQYKLDLILNEQIKKYCYISEITVGELLYGAFNSDRKEEVLKEVREFVEEFQIIPIYSTLPLYADFKAKLRKQGNLIDDFDILIAAAAAYNDMVMVTENVKHFSRIPNLKIENWVIRD